jgi:hypothetical protein
MGVLSRLRDFDEVAAEIGREDAVAVLSCNNCVRACGTGGEMHLTRICNELAARGVRVDEQILIPNPCSRGYLENYPLGDSIKAAVLMTCVGTEAGFRTVHPTVRTVTGVESLGLFINSKAKGRLKLIAPFPGFENLKNKEFKLGDTKTMYEDEQLPLEVTP